MGSDSTLGVEARAKLESRVRNMDENAARRISGSGKTPIKHEKYTGPSGGVQVFNPAVDSTLGKRKIKEEAEEEDDSPPQPKKAKASVVDDDEENTPKKKETEERI